MAQFNVLVSFTDSKDTNAKNGENVYWAGKDTYPRKGRSATQERIAELQGEKNALGKPVISKDAVAEEPKTAEPAAAAPLANSKDK